jgi:ubiquinone/menaquinone biosynthesis C-methylase UbiE
MVEIAARCHPEASFVRASATELPFADESFDAAVGNIVIQHVGEPERATRELARILVPGDE